MPDTDTPQEGTDQLDHESGETTDDPTIEQSDEATEGDPQDGVDPQIASLRRESARYRTRLREAEAERDRLREQSDSDQEAAVDAVREEARAEARAEALAEANGRLIRAEVLAVAAQARLHDPYDAVAHLSEQLASVEVGDDGHVDREALATAVAELIKAKPYLAGVKDPEFGARTPPEQAGMSMDDLMRSGR